MKQMSGLRHCHVEVLMGFEQEWGELRSQAAERQATSMRLNQAAAPSGGGGPDFASTPVEKRKAADAIDKEGGLWTATKTAGDFSDEATGAAVKEFDGWDTAAGIKDVEKKWEGQVKMLLGRLTTEAGALRGTSSWFMSNDLGTGGLFKPTGQSKLDGVDK